MFVTVQAAMPDESLVTPGVQTLLAEGSEQHQAETSETDAVKLRAAVHGGYVVAAFVRAVKVLPMAKIEAVKERIAELAAEHGTVSARAAVIVRAAIESELEARGSRSADEMSQASLGAQSPSTRLERLRKLLSEAQKEKDTLESGGMRVPVTLDFGEGLGDASNEVGDQAGDWQMLVPLGSREADGATVMTKVSEGSPLHLVELLNDLRNRRTMPATTLTQAMVTRAGAEFLFLYGAAQTSHA